MTVRTLLRGFTSARVTVSLLCLLALLFVANVALPQASVLGSAAFADLVTGHPVRYFFLVTLGLGSLSTSTFFLSVLALFFANLGAVLAARFGPTWRRSRMRPRSEEGLLAWIRAGVESGEALSAPRPPDLAPPRMVRALQGHGYRVRRVGERTFHGVKHRTAPLGFVLFHLSFFLVFAGGLALYTTRYVASASLVEGQELRTEDLHVLRRPMSGAALVPSFTVDRVDPRFEEGQPVYLGAVVSFRRTGGAVERPARINGPARSGATAVLLQQAGLAPVLWLQDGAGFTVDRVAASAGGRPGDATPVPLADGRLTVLLEPLPAGTPFPGRGELAATALPLQVLAGDEVVFAGALRPGEGAVLAGGWGRLVMEEVRYWVGVQVVRERGGGLLVAGFLLGVVGLVWRLLWYRREVALGWDDANVRLVGRSEYYSVHFQGELAALLASLRETAKHEGQA